MQTETAKKKNVHAHKQQKTKRKRSIHHSRETRGRWGKVVSCTHAKTKHFNIFSIQTMRISFFENRKIYINTLISSNRHLTARMISKNRFFVSLKRQRRRFFSLSRSLWHLARTNDNGASTLRNVS